MSADVKIKCIQLYTTKAQKGPKARSKSNESQISSRSNLLEVAINVLIALVL